MKNVICFLVALFCVYGIKAQDKAIIRGVIETQDIKQVCFYKVVDGMMELCGRYPVNSTGSFQIEYTPGYDGFYVLGDMDHNTMIYLKKGEQVQLRIQNNMRMMLMGKNGKENEALFKWYTYSDSIKGKCLYWMEIENRSTYVDFFPLDVWATWCEPCKAEIPHLLKLEETMRNLGVVFLGVSLDAVADKEKWQECVIDNKLKGIQLFAGDRNQIVKDYSVKSIPRFIVVGKDGNIVAWDAPHPSNPALARLLLKTVND